MDNGQRFHVSTCEGYLVHAGYRGGPQVGLSAYVIDRPWAHRVVAAFRSEDFVLDKNEKGQVRGGKRLGKGGALVEAHALAKQLNAEDARL